MTAEFSNVSIDLTLEGSLFQRVGAPTAKTLFIIIVLTSGKKVIQNQIIEAEHVFFQE